MKEGIENNCGNKRILISSGPALFEAAENFILNFDVQIWVGVDMVKVPKSRKDMVEARI
jgi:hypothetical protein